MYKKYTSIAITPKLETEHALMPLRISCICFDDADADTRFSGRVILFRQSVSSIFRHIESQENFEEKKKKMQPANVSAPPSPPTEYIPWTGAVS